MTNGCPGSPGVQGFSLGGSRRAVRRNKEPRLLKRSLLRSRPRPRDRSSAEPHSNARELQTPSSALRGRPGMDIMEPRRLEAWREFSRRLKVLAFIGGRVCRIKRGCASASRRALLLPVNGLRGGPLPARVGRPATTAWREPSESRGGATSPPAELGPGWSACCPPRGSGDTRRLRCGPGSWPRPCARGP